MGIETALIAAAVGTTLAQGVGALQAGNLANKNAKIAADQALAAGNTEAATERRRGELQLGSQRAQFGAMGMDPLGNALDVLQNTAFENELSAQTILTNSRYKAWDYRVQGQAAKKQGQMAFISSIGQAASSALTAGAGGNGLGAGWSRTQAGSSFDAWKGGVTWK